MNELDFYVSTEALSRQIAKRRGSPLNYFLSPYIEKYIKKIEAQMGMAPMGANASPLAPSNSLANAIRGGMSGDDNMETSGY